MARNKKSATKVRNLIIMCSVCGLLLIVGTYAWFIGMQSVSVSQFDVTIAAAEGLALSMDGNVWYEEEFDARNTASYSGNTNTWAEAGLIPMSSVGLADDTTSEMVLFEKASLTATKGGYRLLSSRVTYPTTSDDLTDGKGYVAFDLFIRNKSGDEYYAENNALNEEAIYLTTNSEVKVASAGHEGTGIENSVRVGFVQIGRVEQDGATQDQITKIKCADVLSGSTKTTTKICRNATIWEPNDTAHEENAIKWYNEACKARTGATISNDSGYTADACKEISDGQGYTTYAIANELNVGSEVDVYDGEVYNTYEGNFVDAKTYFEASNKTGYKLVEMDYFTDTEKDKPGTSRPVFMTLAPNSVTKVRVYIWIEGQDIDNYDFASLGEQISVNFGFTKERFNEDDIVPTTPSN